MSTLIKWTLVVVVTVIAILFGQHKWARKNKKTSWFDKGSLAASITKQAVKTKADQAKTGKASCRHCHSAVK